MENTLQVWDLSACECLAIHGQAVLKEDRSKECSCFHAAAASTVLVLGMTSGHIRTADELAADDVQHTIEAQEQATRAESAAAGADTAALGAAQRDELVPSGRVPWVRANQGGFRWNLSLHYVMETVFHHYLHY